VGFDMIGKNRGRTPLVAREEMRGRNEPRQSGSVLPFCRLETRKEILAAQAKFDIDLLVKIIHQESLFFV
jgi:hypothetical protein